MILWIEARQSKLPSAKFDGHRHSGSRDIINFVYYVTLQDHLIKVLNEFIFRSPSEYVTILASWWP